MHLVNPLLLLLLKFSSGHDGNGEKVLARGPVALLAVGPQTAPCVSMQRLPPWLCSVVQCLASETPLRLSWTVCTLKERSPW